jgi:hypothetical protein
MRAEPYSQAFQELAVAAVEKVSGPEAAAHTRTRFIEALAALDPESV